MKNTRSHIKSNIEIIFLERNNKARKLELLQQIL